MQHALVAFQWEKSSSCSV